MTRWLKAAKQEADVGTKLTKPTKTPLETEKSVLSVLSERDRAEHSPLPSAKLDDPGSAPNTDSPGGRALTWTGRVVSLEAWRALSEWEKRGPDGRLWCGCCRQWLPRREALEHLERTTGWRFE